MIQHNQLNHVFIENIPDVIESSILYISMEYGTAVHECCCGCGEEIITPLTPTDWSLNYDGESVSLHPSIGNWDIPCRSHYILKRGCVIEAGAWTCEQIEAARIKDKKAKSQFHTHLEIAKKDRPSKELIPTHDDSSWWGTLKKSIRNWL